MRTTLTIDDDLMGILKRRARELDKPFKELVNTALRRGLAAENPGESRPNITVRPHDFGPTPAGLDPGRLNQLVDELEVAEYLGKAAHDDSSGR